MIAAIDIIDVVRSIEEVPESMRVQQASSASSVLSACEKENTRLQPPSKGAATCKILCNQFEFS